MDKSKHVVVLYNGDLYQYEVLDVVIDGLLELAPNEERKEDIRKLLIDGHIDEFNPMSSFQKESNNFDILRRISNSYLMINNPETFDYIRDNKIMFYHGTNSKALEQIINSGAIKPIIALEAEGKTVETGEKSSRLKGRPRNFISFTDVIDLAEDYSTLHTNNEVFPVVIGVTLDTVANLPHFIPKHSYLPEVGVKAIIPVSDIKIVMVPTERIEYVSSILPEHIKVLGMDNLEYKFYYFDHPAPIEAYMKYFDELKEKLESKKLSK